MKRGVCTTWCVPVLVVFVVVLAALSMGNPLPPACEDGRVDVNPELCSYGSVVDKCGKRVCSKGPGEMCGGKYGRYGICDDGLMCSNCNRCQGCSFKTFRCWDDPDCIW